MEKHDMKQCKYLSFKIEKQRQNESLTKTIDCLNSKKAIKEYIVYCLNQYTFQFVIAFKTYTTIKFLKTLSQITDAKILNLKEYESLIARLQDNEFDVYLTYTNPNNNTDNDNTDNNFKTQPTKEEQREDQTQPLIEEVKTELIKEESQLSTEELEEVEEMQESQSFTFDNVNEDIIQSNLMSQIPNKDETINSILTNMFKPIKNYYIWGYNQQIVINKIQQLLEKHQIQSVSQISYSINDECWNIDNQNSQALILIIKPQNIYDQKMYDQKTYDQIYNRISDLVNWSIDEIKTTNGFIHKNYKYLFIVSSQYIQQIIDISKKYGVIQID